MLINIYFNGDGATTERYDGFKIEKIEYSNLNEAINYAVKLGFKLKSTNEDASNNFYSYWFENK